MASTCSKVGWRWRMSSELKQKVDRGLALSFVFALAPQIAKSETAWLTAHATIVTASQLTPP